MDRALDTFADLSCFLLAGGIPAAGSTCATTAPCGLAAQTWGRPGLLWLQAQRGTVAS